jgi:hypothetical protein
VHEHTLRTVQQEESVEIRFQASWPSPTAFYGLIDSLAVFRRASVREDFGESTMRLIAPGLNGSREGV